MGYKDWSDIQIAEETFRCFLNSINFKNRNFNLVHSGLNREQKTFRRYFMILFCIKQTENCTLTDLERLLIENRSTISVAVTKMCDEGFVTKNMPGRGDDGRKVYFRTTEKGDKRLDEYKQVILEDIKKFVTMLSEEGKSYFTSGIENFNKVFEDMIFEKQEVY